MKSALNRYVPKTIIMGLGFISIFAIFQPTYAGTYFSVGVQSGPGWRWHHWHHWNHSGWCYWHPRRCGYYYGPRFCHRVWHPGYRDFFGYWHPGYWTQWCN